ncbi:MAG: SCO family protein [Planctomycetota bacterium]
MIEAPRHTAALLIATAVAWGGSAHAQVGASDTIDELDGVEIEQHLDALLPLDAVFTASSGNETTLGGSFDGERPVILTLNYIDCPQLCSMQLSKLVAVMAEIDLDLGEDYRVVTVSIDPRDTPEKAGGAERRYVGDYRVQSEELSIAREGDSAGWNYLVGDVLEIDRVAETAGFGYRWIESQGEYAHQAATILCSPDGRITRYLSGLMTPADAGTLKTALIEAGDGKVGTLFENAFLNCFIFDPNTGQYTLAATRLLKVAAALMAIAVLGGIFTLRRGEARPEPEGS